MNNISLFRAITSVYFMLPLSLKMKNFIFYPTDIVMMKRTEIVDFPGPFSAALFFECYSALNELYRLLREGGQQSKTDPVSIQRIFEL